MVSAHPTTKKFKPENFPITVKAGSSTVNPSFAEVSSKQGFL